MSYKDARIEDQTPERSVLRAAAPACSHEACGTIYSARATQRPGRERRGAEAQGAEPLRPRTDSGAPKRAAILFRANMSVPDEIFRAVYRGDVGALQTWLTSGGDANGRSEPNQFPGGLNGHSLLETAFYHSADDPRCLSLLLENGGRFAPDFLRRALVAANDERPIAPTAVEFLVQHGADVNYADAKGFSILHVLANGCSPRKALSFIPTIVALGGRVDAKTINESTVNWAQESFTSPGVTPLMLAAERTPGYMTDREEVRHDMVLVARQLLRCGADINVRHGDPNQGTHPGCTAAEFAEGYFHDLCSGYARNDQEVMLEFLKEVERAGSFKKWLKEPRKELLVLRKLVERGRATAPSSVPAFEAAARYAGPRDGMVFTTRDGATGYYSDAAAYVPERLFITSTPAAGGLPDVLFWKVLSFWRSSRDDDDYTPAAVIAARAERAAYRQARAAARLREHPNSRPASQSYLSGY